MKIIGVVIELGVLSKVFEMFFPFPVAIAISAILVYLMFFVIVLKRLFITFWASIEDEY